MAKDTKQRILAAALDMFAERGFAATNVRELAGSLGMHVPAAKLTDEEASTSLTHCFMGTLGLAKGGLLSYTGIVSDKEGDTIDGKPLGAMPHMPVEDTRHA